VKLYAAADRNNASRSVPSENISNTRVRNDKRLIRRVRARARIALRPEGIAPVASTG
jgi:hypothetical protein